MIYRQYTPAIQNQSRIRCYWSITGDAGEGISFRVIPDYCMDIIHFINGESADSFVAGASCFYQDIFFAGSVRVFGIRFMPGGFSSFFRVSAGELSGQVVPLGDVIGERESRNISDCLSAPDEDLCSFYDRYFTETAKYLPEDIFASELLVRSRELDFDHSILDSFSVKTYNRRLHEKVGLNRRSYSKIVRMHKAVSHMLTSGGAYADASCAAGYYDQPHFNREFKELCGTTPVAMNRNISEGSVRFIQYPLGFY